ncbi:MAG: hypothetical protein LC799_27330, partial [Actinobacteria bacterium]|nr:hypothetical protein [Actinomycetota bacterium]
VQRRIAQENERVRAAAPSSYVTVALLDPLASITDDPSTPIVESPVLPPDAIRHRLEGAYTALRRVNTTNVAGDTRPQIQLVLANEGGTEDQWRQVTGQLVQMSKRDEHPLVAVIGLGVSTRQTQQRAEALSHAGIPMVSAYLTADLLDYEHITGLIRVAPSNQYYVDALRGYLGSTDLESGVMVRDSNSENGADLFTQTLARNFEDQMGDLLDFPTLQYTGTGVPAEGVHPRLFASATANICAAAGNGLQAILYAGREIDLNPFLESLETRPCLKVPLTILTAGLDLGEILGNREQALLGSKLTVVVASTVDAEGWKHDVDGTPEYFDEFLSEFEKQGFDPGTLDGANAIMMHDALLTAARAVRLAAPEGSQPTAPGVGVQLLNLNGLYAIPGASGTLNFSADRPKGYPVGKPVPVLQYPQPSAGPSRQVGPLYHVRD